GFQGSNTTFRSAVTRHSHGFQAASLHFLDRPGWWTWRSRADDEDRIITRGMAILAPHPFAVDVVLVALHNAVSRSLQGDDAEVEANTAFLVVIQVGLDARFDRRDRPRKILLVDAIASATDVNLVHDGADCTVRRFRGHERHRRCDLVQIDLKS